MASLKSARPEARDKLRVSPDVDTLRSRLILTPDGRLIFLRAPGDAHHYGIAILSKPRLHSDLQSPRTAHAAPHVDLARFRTDLREAGVEEIIGKLLQTFVEDAPARFAALEQAVKEGNAKAVESAAHAFKSGAGTIRATLLAEGLGQAEATGRAGDLDSITGLLEQIRNEYLAVVSELEATL